MSIKYNNTPLLETERLILRRFSKNDLDDMAIIYSEEETNRFLPWFPHKSRAETENYLYDTVLKEYTKNSAYCYAIQLKETGRVIGYITFHDIDEVLNCGDLGYAVLSEYKNRGIVTEACSAVIARLKEDGFDFITATHDVENPASGKVMKKLGMKYCYSYEEQWQPKNISVVFRLYILNLDERHERFYGKFWEASSIHYVEHV